MKKLMLSLVFGIMLIGIMGFVVAGDLEDVTNLSSDKITNYTEAQVIELCGSIFNDARSMLRSSCSNQSINHTYYLFIGALGVVGESGRLEECILNYGNDIVREIFEEECGIPKDELYNLIINIGKEGTVGPSDCFDAAASIAIQRGDFTFVDLEANIVFIQIIRGPSTAYELESIKLTLNSRGSSILKEIIDIPKINGMKVYNFTGNDFDYGDVMEVTIALVVKEGNTQKICSISSRVLLPPKDKENEDDEDENETDDDEERKREGLGRIIRRRIKAGIYTNEDGDEIRVRELAQGRFEFRFKGHYAETELEIEEETENGRTKFKIKLRNGRNAIIKIMPDVASATALARLRLKVCNATRDCSIELKEVGKGNKTRLVYEVRARKLFRIFGFIKNHQEVRTRIDAETGEEIDIKRPWWAWLASESDEADEIEE